MAGTQGPAIVVFKWKGGEGEKHGGTEAQRHREETKDFIIRTSGDIAART
jgi:hypothetical protein